MCGAARHRQAGPKSREVSEDFLRGHLEFIRSGLMIREYHSCAGLRVPFLCRSTRMLKRKRELKTVLARRSASSRRWATSLARGSSKRVAWLPAAREACAWAAIREVRKLHLLARKSRAFLNYTSRWMGPTSDFIAGITALYSPVPKPRPS